MARKQYKRTIDVNFNSSADLLSYIKDVPDINFSRSYDREDFCKYTFDQSLNMLSAGWNDGIKDIDNRSQAMHHANTVFNQIYQHDVTGDFIDIGAYVTGSPECMMYLDNIPEDKTHINIEVNISAAHKVNQDTIYNRGAAIVYMIDRLYKNHTIDLSFINSVKGNSDMKKNVNFRLTMSLNQGYSRDLIVFILANPAYLRRIGFAVSELTCKKDSLGSYGYVNTGYKSAANIYIKPLLNEDNSAFNSIETSKSYIDNLIKGKDVK